MRLILHCDCHVLVTCSVKYSVSQLCCATVSSRGEDAAALTLIATDWARCFSSAVKQLPVTLKHQGLCDKTVPQKSVDSVFTQKTVEIKVLQVSMALLAPAGRCEN